MSSEVLQSQCLNAGRARSSSHSQSGKVRFLGTDPGQPIPQPAKLSSSASVEEAARGYLAVCGSLFGLQDQAKELVVERFKPLDRGREMVRFQQVYQGVPVFGGEFIVHVDNAKNIVSVSGKALPGIAVTTRPAVDAATARRNALQSVAIKYKMNADDLTATEPRLWVYNPTLVRPGNGFTSLVWRMDVRPKALAPIRELVLIEAQRGVVALSFNQVDTLKNRETYTANNTAVLPGNPVCNESNPTCSGGDTHAVGAHTNAGLTYYFYWNYHGRDSIDGAGMTMRSTVHYKSGYDNAFWDGILMQMVYGDVRTYPLATDVVAHELTHGVTDHESGLFYYYQSGAINESFSDLWGEFVDQVYGTGGSNPWLIGQDVVPAFPGGAIRSMSNPPAYGDPDKMTSLNYLVGETDDGGVHTNSGVNNKAVYLMTAGGSFNGYTIAALGIPKVAKIYYEVQTNLLISGSDYADLYDALYQGCLNLLGTNGIVASDCQQVRNATLAVEMNLQPSSGYNAKAPLCASGQSAVTTFFDNLEGGAGNWSFGWLSGTSRWQYDAPPAYGRFAHSGIHFLYADDLPASVSDSYAAMNTNVLVPANAYLHFAHAYGFEDPDYDGGVVEYSTNSGATWNDAGSLFIDNGYRGTLRVETGGPGTHNPLEGRPAFIGDSHGYISSRLNLSSLAGQNVRFRWRMGLDSIGYDWGWWLDDVRIYTCAGSPSSSNTYLPLITKSDTTAPASGWVTILSEDFEGYFPGPWTVSSNGNFTWGKRDCRPFAGTSSGWAVGRIIGGPGLSCGSYYPNNVNSWMVYGPFSLVGATAAELRFKAWVNTIYPDILGYYASTDGRYYWGYHTWGSSGWSERVLDLSNVYTLGNLLGQPSVWIGFRFYSDPGTTYPEGAHLDNILLRKCPVASCPPIGGSTLNANSVRITDRPETATFPQ
jgi:Zn-dependent metalloprotease